MILLFTLLVIYQIKHFVADYPLQGRFMLGKFLPYPKFILPLLAHSAVHGVSTFIIAACVKGWKVGLALAAFDMITHFAVDRVKASPDLLGRFQALSKKEAIKLMETGVTPKNPFSPSSPEEIAATWKSNTYFWWALGADQMAHHLTHYVIIWFLVM